MLTSGAGDERSIGHENLHIKEVPQKPPSEESVQHGSHLPKALARRSVGCSSLCT